MLDVFSIRVPALRDRPEDIPLLVRYLAHKHAARQGQPPREIDPAAGMLLGGQPWPGNVRELENVVQRAVLLAPSGPITVATIRDALTDRAAPPPPAAATLAGPASDDGPRHLAPAAALVAAVGDGDGLPLAERRPFHEARQEADAAFSRAYLEDLLRQTGGRVAEAARIAEIEASNFRRLLRRFQVHPAPRRPIDDA